MGVIGSAAPCVVLRSAGPPRDGDGDQLYVPLLGFNYCAPSPSCPIPEEIPYYHLNVITNKPTTRGKHPIICTCNVHVHAMYKPATRHNYSSTVEVVFLSCAGYRRQHWWVSVSCGG